MIDTDPVDPSDSGPDGARSWLRQVTLDSLDAPGREWLTDQLEHLENDTEALDVRALDIAFGLAPRRLGKHVLALNDADRRRCATLIPGWRPERWSVDQAARMLLVTALPDAEVENQLERLLRHADLGEQLALYRGLSLYPVCQRVIDQASTGIRSNMRAVFEAVAHHNPWPAANLEQQPWNHLVLKALFIDSSLHPIQQLDERANAELARMLLDYAHERRAAGRSISGELWRCAVPFVDLDELRPFLPVTDLGGHWPATAETAGLALALFQSDLPDAQVLARKHASQFELIESGLLNWTTVYRQEHCSS